MWRAARLERARQRAEDGRPARDRKPLPIRGAEVVGALELFRDSTGDLVFTAALRAITKYGFEREPHRTAARLQRERFGNPIEDYLIQVAFLVEHGKLGEQPAPRQWRREGRRRFSIREACEAVVAEFAVPGSSFEATVKDLRTRYRTRRTFWVKELRKRLDQISF
jgi:hypothetical protein